MKLRQRAARRASVLGVLAPILFGVLPGAAGCVEERPPLEGTQSLRVELVAPANPGSPDARLPPADRTLTVNITALDAAGEVDTTYTKAVQVYAQFLGTLTPSLGGAPLATIQVNGGVAMNQQITLPPVFGPTTVWIDDGASPEPTFATGTSPTLWYPDPFIKDLQTPPDERALNALSASPLEEKQITVGASRYGSRGRLVVNSVFAQGYTVSDVQCADDAGNPPCTTQPYDHMMVFSFSAARTDKGELVREGMVIKGFAGGQSEFNGLTEIGFPQTFADENAPVDPAYIPPPVVLDPATWFKSLTDPSGGMINFERNEAAPIAVVNGKVCDLDDDFATYKQWKLDPAGVGGNCSSNDNVVNVITAGISTVDPMALVGQSLARVVGVLRPVSIGSFNVWIIYPRSAADVQM